MDFAIRGELRTRSPPTSHVPPRVRSWRSVVLMWHSDRRSFPWALPFGGFEYFAKWAMISRRAAMYTGSRTPPGFKIRAAPIMWEMVCLKYGVFNLWMVCCVALSTVSLWSGFVTGIRFFVFFFFSILAFWRNIRSHKFVVWVHTNLRCFSVAYTREYAYENNKVNGLNLI